MPTDAPFSAAEYAGRLARTRARMAEAGLDLLLLSDPCNIYYLSGYDGWSFYTPQLLVVAHDRPPVWFGREMDVFGVRTTSSLRSQDVVGYPDRLVQSPPDHPFDELAPLLADMGQGGARIGVEKDSYYLTAGGLERLAGRLPSATIIDASRLVNWVRFVKSPAEIALMRQAGELLAKSMTAAFEAIAPGVRESDVVAAIYAAQISGTDAFGGLYTSSPAFVMSGPRIATPHLPWTDAPLVRGGQVNLELMGNRRRYQVTMGRTVVLGEPSRELRRLEAIVCEAIEAVLAFAKPGVACEEVELVLRGVLKRNGIEKTSRCGYSLGIAYPPTGGELTASFRAGDKTVLEVGSTMHFLPAIWSADESLIISEPFVVTATGAECLADVPRRLIVR